MECVYTDPSANVSFEQADQVSLNVSHIELEQNHRQHQLSNSSRTQTGRYILPMNPKMLRAVRIPCLHYTVNTIHNNFNNAYTYSFTLYYTLVSPQYGVQLYVS